MPARFHIVRQVPGGDHRVRRQAVDLRLVEQQEERAVAADAVVGSWPYSRASVTPRVVQRVDPLRGPVAQLVERRRTGSTRSGRPGRRPASGPSPSRS